MEPETSIDQRLGNLSVSPGSSGPPSPLDPSSSLNPSDSRGLGIGNGLLSPPPSSTSFSSFTSSSTISASSSQTIPAVMSDGERSMEYRKWDEKGREWLYGYVWFEQRKDRGIARGYMQVCPTHQISSKIKLTISEITGNPYPSPFPIPLLRGSQPPRSSIL